MKSEKAARFVYRLEKLQWAIPIDEIELLRRAWLRLGYQTARLRLWFEGNGEVI
jgi:hypothetical protein